MLSCIVLIAACNGASPESTAGDNTEVELVISDPATANDELLQLIDFVSYRILCEDSGLTPYDDSVELNGNFEVDASADPPVWELATDLPLANCSITLWVFYEDEVVCQGTEAMPIIEDGDPSTVNKFDIVLECNLSVDPPSGDADIDADFDLINGNYCPQLNWLGVVPTASPFQFDVQVRTFDPDGTCGLNCDPQTCDFTVDPPVCTPGPDPGLTTTLSNPTNNGFITNPNAADTTFNCNPLFPGRTQICVDVTDGDLDCDKRRCEYIDCPDLCAGVDCNDNNECTRDRCNLSTGECLNDIAPDGIACDDCNSTCQGGTCDPSVPYTADQTGPNLSFIGTIQFYSATLFNPYSGESVVVNGTYRVNEQSYKGNTSNDILTGTNQNDVLLIQDPLGVQRMCGVDVVRPLNSFDVMYLSDSFIVLNDMTIEGGNADDILWANSGNDTISGETGDDLIDGGPGDDDIDGGFGNDTISLWPGSGFDLITGGPGALDRVTIRAVTSQVAVTPSGDINYPFDIAYLGTPMARIGQVEELVLEDGSIDLTQCLLGDCELCGNGILNGGEECDDGNLTDGDGCASDCTIE